MKKQILTLSLLASSFVVFTSEETQLIPFTSPQTVAILQSNSSVGSSRRVVLQKDRTDRTDTKREKSGGFWSYVCCCVSRSTFEDTEEDLEEVEELLDVTERLLNATEGERDRLIAANKALVETQQKLVETQQVLVARLTSGDSLAIVSQERDQARALVKRAVTAISNTARTSKNAMLTELKARRLLDEVAAEKARLGQVVKDNNTYKTLLGELKDPNSVAALSERYELLREGVRQLGKKKSTVGEDIN